MNDIPMRSRFRGALLGLACGDALGTTLEFTPPEKVVPLTDMVGGGPFGLKAGQWTDDTSMALCLADSLLDAGFDPQDQLRRYVAWWRTGYRSSTGRCFDIGVATSRALSRFEKTGGPVCGSKDVGSSGNGCIMRLAPVAMYHANTKISELLADATASCKTTHASPDCINSVRVFANMLRIALNGGLKTDIWAAARVVDRCSPPLQEVISGSYLYREPPSIKGSGYVVKSLEAALWAFAKSRTFEEGALLAVNLGNDADTTGAVYGQIAGAFYGDVGLPPKWLERLHEGEAIRDLADRLYVLSQEIA